MTNDVQGAWDVENAANPNPITADVIATAKRYLVGGNRAAADQLLKGFGWRVDDQTGQPRPDTWWEKYREPVLVGAGMVTAGVAAPYLAGGAGGSGAAAAGTSALGPTTTGSMAATSAAAAGSSVPASLALTGGGGVNYASLLSKYLIPGANEAVNAIINQKNADANRQQEMELNKLKLALDQTKLDPFRGQMHQASDVARLERMVTPPTPYGPRAGSPYAAYATPRAMPPLSSDYLNTVTNARGNIARGQGAVPNQLDPSNWSANGTSNLSQPAPPTQAPRPPVQTPTPAAPPADVNTAWQGAEASPPPAGASYRPPIVAPGLLPSTDPNAPPTPDPNNPYAGLSLASLLARYGPGARRQGGFNA